MARIRSVKPEFWKSPNIAPQLPRGTRLTYIALWNYVDDNAVGVDNDKLIVAEIYPLEDDPHEALSWIHEDLMRLHEAGRIARYIVGSRQYLQIENFEHQKIANPRKSRYPRSDHPDAIPVTCGNSDTPQNPHEEIISPTEDVVSTTEILSPGSGIRDQGSGIREFAAPPASRPVGELVPVDDPRSNTILAQWIDHCKAGNVQLHKNVIGQYAKEIKSALDQKFTPDLIKRTLSQMLSDGVAHQPRWFPQRLVATQTGPERRRYSTPGDSATRTLTDDGNDAEVMEALSQMKLGGRS